MYFAMRWWAATMALSDIMQYLIIDIRHSLTKSEVGIDGGPLRRPMLLQNFLMLSQSTITEVHELDVLFVGNLAAIAADLLAAKTARYKLGVAHLDTEIEEPSLFPLAPTTLSVVAKPRGVQVIRQRIRRLNPGQKSAFLEDGKKIVYKLLVYGEGSRWWAAVQQGSPFREALLTPYSLVYAGRDPRWEEMLQLKSGNVVFYVGKGRSSYEQNYPFLYIYDRFSLEQQRRIKFIVILDDQTFYQFCPLAHRVLDQQLRAARFKVIYGGTIKQVDYLKRTMQIVSRDGIETIPYAALHCSLPESTPELLARGGIDPYRAHEKYLHNLQYDSLYVVGGSTLPTTHSYTAVNHQLHVMVANVHQRLDYLYGLTDRLQLAAYRGTTAIRILLSRSELVEIVHGYKDHEHEVSKRCTCFSFLLAQRLDPYLAHKYYNFKSYGLPHFVCAPSTPLDSQEEEGTLSQLQLRPQPL